MNERLQKIADDLGKNEYREPLHGEIAKLNFVYGVEQMRFVAINGAREAFCKTCLAGVGLCEHGARCDTLRRFMNILKERI